MDRTDHMKPGTGSGGTISVRHRDGWCATRRSNTGYSDTVPTICGQYVTLPLGLERREPDCSGCEAILAEERAEATSGDRE